MLAPLDRELNTKDGALSVPKISIVVICYNMAREVPRTVTSFLSPYQVGIEPDDVEVIVMENGSSEPVPSEVVASWPAQVRYHIVEDPHPSPAQALNEGVAMATADLVCPVIDGARMASPGLVNWGLRALAQDDRSIALTAGFHLGEKLQQIAVEEGYNQEVEDELLTSIGWPENGYRLFEICALAGSAQFAWFGDLRESNAPILPKALFEEMGGYDEAFNIPGGGLINLDFLNRLRQLPDTSCYTILGEGTFHQFHGGVTTSRRVHKPEDDGVTTWKKYNDQYEAIRGKPYAPSGATPVLFGRLTPDAASIAETGLQNMLQRARRA